MTNKQIENSRACVGMWQRILPARAALSSFGVLVGRGDI